MRRAQLLVELPEGMSLACLRDRLATKGVILRHWETVEGEATALVRQPAQGRLSPAERDVLQAFAGYDSTQEIAEALHVSPETVKSHVKSLYQKLQVRSRAHAIGRAVRLGELTLQDLVQLPCPEKNPPYGG